MKKFYVSVILIILLGLTTPASQLDTIKTEVYDHLSALSHLTGNYVLELDLLNTSDLDKYSNELFTWKIDPSWKKKLIPGQRLESRMVLPVTISEKKKAVKKANITLDLKVLNPVAYSSRLIYRGEIFGEDNVVFVTRNSLTLPGSVFKSLAELKDCEARYDISESRLLTGASIRKIPVLKKGSKINLVFAQGRLKVTAEGLAMQDGYIGEKIKVQNLASRKYLEGKVVDQYTVSVN
ncbi:MAG: flagellar basal body P-ring formation chaperone FlgA [Candidatus Margulisiibacteriota bacterium]|jgi:flagella basal body P-ring formation protein FlgA